MSVNYCALKCVYMLNICAIINPWAQDAFWTSYVRSIYVLCLRWSMYVKHVNPYNTRTHLSKIISWGCNWVNQFQIKWLHKILGVPGTLFYKTISRAAKSPASHVCLPQFYFFYHLPAFWKKVDFCLIRLNYETLLFTFSQAAANIFKYFAHTPNKENTY